MYVAYINGVHRGNVILEEMSDAKRLARCHRYNDRTFYPSFDLCVYPQLREEIDLLPLTFESSLDARLFGCFPAFVVVHTARGDLKIDVESVESVMSHMVFEGCGIPFVVSLDSDDYRVLPVGASGSVKISSELLSFVLHMHMSTVMTMSSVKRLVVPSVVFTGSSSLLTASTGRNMAWKAVVANMVVYHKKRTRDACCIPECVFPTDPEQVDAADTSGRFRPHPSVEYIVSAIAKQKCVEGCPNVCRDCFSRIVTSGPNGYMRLSYVKTQVCPGVYNNTLQLAENPDLWYALYGIVISELLPGKKAASWADYVAVGRRLCASLQTVMVTRWEPGNIACKVLGSIGGPNVYALYTHLKRTKYTGMATQSVDHKTLS